MALRPWLRTSSHHGAVRANWWTERAGEVAVLRRSTPRQTRWSPHRHWPVLQLLFPSKEGVRGGVGVAVEVDRVDWLCRVGPGGHLGLVGRFCRCSPSQCPRRTHSDPGRFQIGAGGRPCHPRSLSRVPSLSIRVVPGQSLVVFSLRSRLCRYRRRLPCLASHSTSPSLTL